MHEPAVTYRNRWRFRWEAWRRRIVPWLLEDQADQGLGGPPNNWRDTGPILVNRGEKGERHEAGARFSNDALDVSIWERWGDAESRWVCTLDTATFRRIALWYLWRWAWGEWFGLRRRLFYWHLRRRVRAMQRWRREAEDA